MKKISRRSFLKTSGVMAAMAALTACGGSSAGSSSAASAPSGSSDGKHEPITIMDANRDYSNLIELVHKTYPEINIQIEPYKGGNTTAYMKKQLMTGILPDIYCTTQTWDDDLLRNNLVDLSKYPITDLYNPVRLNEMDVDGATYLLPYDYTIMYGRHLQQIAFRAAWAGSSYQLRAGSR